MYVEREADAVVVAARERRLHARRRGWRATLTRLRSPGAPITRANTPMLRGSSGIGPPDHLVGDRVEAVVAVMRLRDAGRSRVRERQAGVVEVLVGEAAAVVPDAELVACPAARSMPRADHFTLGRLVDRVLQLADPQRAVVQVEVGAALVVRVVAERIAVEHAGERGQRRRDLAAHAHAEGRQRISRDRPTACRTTAAPASRTSC